MSGRVVIDDTQHGSAAKLVMASVMANGPTGFIEVSISDGFGGFLRVQVAEADLESAAASVVSR